MPSTYPAVVDSFPVVANETVLEDLHPAAHNEIQSAIVAIQTALGTNPQGPEASVEARIQAIEDIPPSSGSLVVADVTLTAVSQSSVYGGTTAGTVANLSDGDTTTGTGTNTSAAEYVQVDWSGLKLIVGVRIGAGSIAGFGGTSNYVTKDHKVEYWDGAAWVRTNPLSFFPTRVPQNSGETTITFPLVPCLASKLRISTYTGYSNYVGLTEFVPIEMKVA